MHFHMHFQTEELRSKASEVANGTNEDIPHRHTLSVLSPGRSVLRRQQTSSPSNQNTVLRLLSLISAPLEQRAGVNVCHVRSLFP